jgi:putative transposase
VSRHKAYIVCVLTHMCRQMRQTAISCEQSGFAIAQIDDAIKRISESVYKVKYQNGNGEYDVSSTDLGWVCSCPDHKFRGVKCKHIFAVEISFALHKEVEVAHIQPLDINCCIFCTSANVVKDGLRHNKRGDIQKYHCRECNRYFTINLGFERMRATPQVITSALQLYFTGESFRNIQKFLRLQGVNINHNTRLLSMDKEIRHLDEGILRKNHTKCCRCLEGR